MPVVEVYTKQVCPFCVHAKALLQHKGVDFKEIRVDEDPAELDTMLARSEGRRTVPQIFINGEGIGGFDALKALDASGELDKKLADN